MNGGRVAALAMHLFQYYTITKAAADKHAAAPTHYFVSISSFSLYTKFGIAPHFTYYGRSFSLTATRSRPRLYLPVPCRGRLAGQQEVYRTIPLLLVN